MATVDMPASAPAGTHQPTHGFTRLGQEVHRYTASYLPVETAYQRFNKRLALWITQNVGTMTCFWLFTVIALLSLPATLKLAGIVKSWGGVLPAFMLTFGFIFLIQWVAQSYFQLVLLPALMVAQNLQNEAADARAAKTFEDVEDAKNCIKVALDLLDLNTEGGLKTVLDAVESLRPAS
jgi:hypothetical protein